MVNVFAVPIFFVCFRECLETTIIVSVLLSFLKQSIGPERDPVLYKKVKRQVWSGVVAGLAIVLVIGGAFIGVFYGLGTDLFSSTEDVWEGSFSIVASIIITVMGAALLRISKLQDKWRMKLALALESRDKSETMIKTKFIRRRLIQGSIKHWCEKYAMFLLPFITVLREGLEAVVFIGGVSLSIPATAFPLAVISGLGCGILIGYLIYRGGNVASLQIFLIVSTCFLYLVAAGLFSKGVWSLEINAWNKIIGGDAAEVGSGPGSYDVRKSVWHVNGANPEINGGGGWGIFNALFGWTNSATLGSVISYNLYWIFVIAMFFAMRYNEVHGHWPMMKAKTAAEDEKRVSQSESISEGSASRDGDVEMIGAENFGEKGRKNFTAVREMRREDSSSSSVRPSRTISTE